MDRGALWAIAHGGLKESDTTKWLTHRHTHRKPACSSLLHPLSVSFRRECLFLIRLISREGTFASTAPSVHLSLGGEGDRQSHQPSSQSRASLTRSWAQEMCCLPPSHLDQREPIYLLIPRIRLVGRPLLSPSQALHLVTSSKRNFINIEVILWVTIYIHVLTYHMVQNSVSEEGVLSPGHFQTPVRSDHNMEIIPPLESWCLRKSEDPYGRKWRGTKKPLDEIERGEWKSWLKAQYSEN